MRTPFAPLALVAALLAGCAATLQDTLTVTLSPSAPPAIRSLAILPIQAGEGLEAVRRTIGDSLAVAIAARRTYDVIPPDTVLRRINAAGLARDYAEMLTAYRETGIMDAGTLQRMTAAVGASHLLTTTVRYEATRELARGVNSVYEQDRQLLRFEARLWDTAGGDVVWEAVGGPAVETTEWTYVAHSLPALASAGVRALVARIP